MNKGNINDRSKYERVFKMPFKTIYDAYIIKAENKGRTKEEVDEILIWFTSYSKKQLDNYLLNLINVETFFEEMTQLPTNANLITGVICGIRVENITDPLIQKVRYLDKLIDELAKGKSMDKIFRM